MYNVFLHEKKVKEGLNKILNDEKQKILKSKKNNQVIKLRENYEKRIKKFIFDMAENPLKIRDYVSPNNIWVKNTIHQDSSKLTYGSNSYRNNERDYIFSTTRSKADITLETKDSSRSEKLNQGLLAFKAKNEIERVIDEYNKISNVIVIYNRLKDEISKNIVSNPNNQLRGIQNNELFEDNSIMRKFSSTKNDLDTRNYNSEDDKYSTNYFGSRKKEKFIDKKKIFSEYNNKTHFKAASDIAAFNQIGVANLINESSTRYEKVQKSITSISKNQNEFKSKKIDDLKSIIIKNMNKDIFMKNPMLFNINKVDQKNEVNSENLEKIRILSLKPHLNEDKKSSKKLNLLNFLKKPKKDLKNENKIEKFIFNGIFGNSRIFNREEEKIVIDNEEFLKSDTQKIAKKILTACNFYHQKSNSILSKR